ncbi:MAG: glycosyltransferase family 2 protein [Promethearchaeota archaeon]
MIEKNSFLNRETEFIENDIIIASQLNYKFLISIIIPLYNEEKSIRNIINRIPNFYDYEIIIVDDGSTDNSIEEILKIKRKNIKLIRHKKNQGYGASILDGIKRAKGDIIITIDSDGQHNPEEIPVLIEPLLNNESDIVIGSRYEGKSTYKVALHTRAGEYIVKKSLWVLYHQLIGNNQSGFRAFTKKTLKLFDNIIFSKFGLCTEILFKAGHAGFRIKEVPIIINERRYGVSTNHVGEILKSISSIIFLHFLKKIRIDRIIPKLIWQRIYSNMICYLRKLY